MLSLRFLKKSFGNESKKIDQNEKKKKNQTILIRINIY